MTKQMDSRFHGNDEDGGTPPLAVGLVKLISRIKETHPKKWATPLIRLFLCIAIAILLPALSSAELASFFDEPDTVFASNTVIDIIEHNGGIWFATGEGVNFSLDSGRTWLLYDSTNGLVSDNISAIYSLNGRIWVATSHGFGNEALSDGLTYSDDNGQNWFQVDFSPDGLDIPYVWGGNRTIFDITGHQDDDYDIDHGVDWLFFTAFAGGFLASQDNGLSWRRIFPTFYDSVNFVNTYADPRLDTLWERNRYFSCAADTSHHDSLYIWAGTAGGVFQYVYASPRVKPLSKRVNAIAFCDECSDSSFVFLGGDSCMIRGMTHGAPFISRFVSDGLPGPYISAVIDFRGKLFVGTMDSEDGLSTGLAVSEDRGETYTDVWSFPDIEGANRKISEFAVIRERLYMAAEEAGLFVSVDTGQTWSHIYVDSDTASDNRRNVVHALDALADTLRIGTDSGLVTLYMDSVGQIDSSRFYVFLEGATSSAKVIRVRTQLFFDPTGENYDSLAIWTVNRPLTSSGKPAVFMSYWDHDTLFSPGMLVGENTNDINFIGDTAVIVAEDTVTYTQGEGIWWPYEIRDGNDNLNRDTVRVMAVKGDTIFFGTDNGFAISNDRGETYNIFRINTDSLSADFVVNFTRLNTSFPPVYYGLTGDFIPALGVQHIEDEWARIWVSCRPAHGGSAGISVGLVVAYDDSGKVVDRDSPDAIRFERSWASVYPDGFAWNFAFNGDSVFAATDGGLLFNYQDTGLTWDTIDLVDTLGVPLILPGTPVYAVEVIDSSLWVGTGDRTLRLNLDSLKVDLSFCVVDSATPPDQVYAFPVPFSHSQDLGVDFHFTVEREAEVTLEIYDFAMNLVKRVIDNQSFPAGIYPAAGAQRRTWDGRNGRGDQVAVGMYYFKVEYSTGEVRWGKIAVIP